MRIWIDTEYNDFKGDLISIALVAETGEEWYRVTYCEKPSEWVAKHVIPILGRPPISLDEMRVSLHNYLSGFQSIHLIADWPEDIAHFCNLLISSPGYRIDTPPLTLEIRRDLDAISEVPHNALSDALAIKAKHIELFGSYAYPI